MVTWKNCIGRRVPLSFDVFLMCASVAVTFIVSFFVSFFNPVDMLLLL